MDLPVILLYVYPAMPSAQLVTRLLITVLLVLLVVLMRLGCTTTIQLDIHNVLIPVQPVTLRTTQQIHVICAILTVLNVKDLTSIVMPVLLVLDGKIIPATCLAFLEIIIAIIVPIAQTAPMFAQSVIMTLTVQPAL